MSTEDLRAELARLRTIKEWRPVTLIERVLRERQPVELAQDAYYYGTAADLRREHTVADVVGLTITDITWTEAVSLTEEDFA
jgi:hypothetical protein